ncbi:hypothetical protein AWB80_00744 [Caballeronia pedi]|uniref:Uncharacterized protein n=1 Tax=Caballeronia pedi TaxID=1777141 RepID=A0A157ZFW3_9BURK|nr:hypothetical protein [Caballeronia pedi]SAK44319.1 hypothetical protein AWB80_00744 [Caballeronia pedi]
MNFLRKLFGNEFDGGRRRSGKGYDTRYHADDQAYDDERWDRHPGSIPPLPPDLICPQCRKSNLPRTLVCKQCDTWLGGDR